MATDLRRLYRRLPWYYYLSLRTAYGQLLALVFFPIVLLTLVGAWLVLQETYRAIAMQERNTAQMILSRYQPAAQTLAPILSRPGGSPQATQILQPMLSEPDLQRVALLDQEGRVRVGLGYGSNSDWPAFDTRRELIGPLHSPWGTVYGQRVGFSSDSPIWLVVDMAPEPARLARYRVWLVLCTTGLFTLLLLLMSINIYSRRWVAPIFEMRLLLQRIDLDHLDQPFDSSSSGELLLLQHDISQLLNRLHRNVRDLQAHTEETEADLRRSLDELEMQNITYRKARDAAIAASKAKSVFLANISHELRTPLNSIDGFIKLLLRRGELNREQQVFVETIRKSSDHLLALINDVLDFSKIEAGKLALETAPFNLEEAVFEVMDMLSPQACEKSLSMAVFYYADVPRQVIGDVLRVRQILTNLVSNAIKFTPEGEIIVRVELEHSTVTGHTVKISVQDSGIGLLPADRDKLFQSFSQADPSVTRQFGGTGLGLAISRQLARLMDGSIGFEDNAERDGQGKGSTFWVSLTLGRLAEPDLPWPVFPGWSVLAQINHAASCNVLRGYLGRMEVSFEEAQSVPDLLGRLDSFAPQGRGWVIVENDDHLDALLREIRLRYHGPLAVFGYQMAISTEQLDQHQARALYQPLSRTGLLALLQDAPQPIESREDFSAQNLHVLAVDDHLPNLMVLDALLAELGIKVTTVSSGADAIAQIESRHARQQPPFHLVFMDIQMPRMSGLQACQRIRELEAQWSGYPRTPVIALTAHALADERDQLMAAGMDDYVSKPIQHQQLIHLLRQWTQSPTRTASRRPVALPAPPPPPAPPAALDWAESLRLSSQKPELARDLLTMLLRDLPADQLEMGEALQQKDWPRLYQRVHRLHGATRYVGVPELRQVTARLEQQLTRLMASATPLEALPQEVLEQLEQVFFAIDRVLDSPVPFTGPAGG